MGMEQEEDVNSGSEEDTQQYLDGKLEQQYGGVTVLYDSKRNWLKTDDGYVELLDGISRVPPTRFVQFQSRVGVAAVALLAGALGIVFGSHLVLLFLTFSFPSVLTQWSIYALFMCIYHWSEFLVTAYYHPHSCTFDSFLVNQSLEFGVAIIASWIEFWLESWFVPWLKTGYPIIPAIGIVVIIIGQTFRTLAMIQAGPSFTHMIAHKKEKRHQLITHGLYSVFRHPGYFGWFYWSVATQLLLCNPLCTVAYLLASQRFFRARIPIEEDHLLRIFGAEYEEYRARTWLGIPGIPPTL